MSISRALISVSDKTGLDELAKGLHRHGVEILSTGGTAKFISALGIPVTEVSDFTRFPEMLDGRVKTLHPKVHGGLLYRRDLPEHCKQAAEHGILPIDLVVVNLYPFEQTVAKEGVTREEAIEQIDIGGPSMLRSASKNHDAVTVVVDPADYAVVLTEMDEHKGATTLKTRERLAIKVFQRTAAYDAAIAAHLNAAQETEASFSISLPLSQELRYGENPHQKASLYGNFTDHFKQLQGKELSYTNVLDIAAAGELILEFRRPAVAILKHTNPCGVGADENDLRLAWEKAFETDGSSRRSSPT
jgi:phosphoribosylaminoimidazolecarboxamide formyltransferase/IMP cyclohydrolase